MTYIKRKTGIKWQISRSTRIRWMVQMRDLTKINMEMRWISRQTWSKDLDNHIHRKYLMTKKTISIFPQVS